MARATTGIFADGRPEQSILIERIFMAELLSCKSARLCRRSLMNMSMDQRKLNTACATIALQGEDEAHRMY